MPQSLSLEAGLAEAASSSSCPASQQRHRRREAGPAARGGPHPSSDQALCPRTSPFYLRASVSLCAEALRGKGPPPTSHHIDGETGPQRRQYSQFYGQSTVKPQP